jgi:hypothetical protein
MTRREDRANALGTPVQRLSRWLTTNAGMPDEPSQDEVTRLIDAMGGSSIPDALAEVVAALRENERRER